MELSLPDTELFDRLSGRLTALEAAIGTIIRALPDEVRETVKSAVFSLISDDHPIGVSDAAMAILDHAEGPRLYQQVPWRMG